MTGRIIQLSGDRHQDILLLLPWYLAGDLSAPEHDRVRAHLSLCAECQAELQDERRLAAGIGDLPIEAGLAGVEHGWMLASQQIDRESRSGLSFRAWRQRLFARPPMAARSRRSQTPWLRWAVAGQFCLLLIMGVTIWLPSHPAQYHTLGGAPSSRAANIVVIFRPDTPEKDLRAILKSNGARLVDGPTPADAYMLHVPAAGRAATLTRLQRLAQVVLAEPVDAE
ncbi:MAG TPA: zf-HC2 domain-containing protein [Caulobacteraceae bacterium]|jgi:hypothetical protein